MQIAPSFQKSQAEFLQGLLSAPERSEDTMSYGEVCGFLFVVACAPEMINPSEWIPLIIGDEGLDGLEQADVQQALGAMMSLYNELNRQVQEHDTSLPDGIAFSDDISENFAHDASISQWSRGFIIGHNWLEDLWKEYIPDDLSEEFASQMLVLSIFASYDMADQFHQESNNNDDSIDHMAENMRKLFPGAMEGFAELGNVIQTVLRERAQTPAVSNKVGRNEACPCGSGKKYKKCCALKLH